ncbi:hypothetical protein BMS3Abin07_02501 [bacterium BMS3Abin07]|nr:hypothetical protein BMS3Abin07_02501 [bacterium BMS3Abin07]GBE31182.1 hypothetical protein BMS3Bbin05_00079 [bacterium BMS3Bbin05]HDO23484.1 hypothetical protein [Nitrospirota bacterium]HDZ87132.1 hypothetical protein [Nitrospirota bacterium]
MFRKISSAFSAGALGGLANSLAVWFFGVAGISAAFGVTLTPRLTPPWLYPRIIWGGLWGFLFLIPVMRGSILVRGFIYSLGPTFVMLFIILPKMGKGVYGLSLGTLMPVLVVIFSFIWGIAAAFWFRNSGE